jgi:hypothetical protein
VSKEKASLGYFNGVRQQNSVPFGYMLMWHGFDILLFDDIINPTTTTTKYIFLGTHAHDHPSFGVHFMCCQNMLRIWCGKIFNNPFSQQKKIKFIVTNIFERPFYT